MILQNSYLLKDEAKRLLNLNQEIAKNLKYYLKCISQEDI